MTMPASFLVQSAPWHSRIVACCRAQPAEVATLCYAAAYLAIVFLAGARGGVFSLVGNVAFFAIGLLTIREQLRVASSRSNDIRTRRAWAFLAASCAAIWFSGVTWTIWIWWNPGIPDPLWSQLLNVLYIPLAAIGFASFPAGARFTLRDRGARMDAILLTLGGIALSWHFSLRPLLSDPDNPALGTIATVMSEWLVAVLASVAYLRVANPVMRRAIAIALGAHLSYILSDFFWVSSKSTYLPGHWLDALWFGSWMLRWAAARQASRAEPSPGSSDGAYAAGLAPALFVAGAYSLLLLAVQVEGQRAGLDIAVAAGVMTVLLLVRQGMALADNRRLDRATAAIAARYRSIVSHAADFVMVVDETFALAFVSPSVEKVLGVACGSPFDALVHPDDQRRVNAWLIAPAEGPGETAPRCRFRTAAGKWIDVELRAQDRRADPVLQGIVVNGRDISAEVALEDQLGHARKLATLSDMAGRIAHAFNNTLAVLQGHAELLAHQLPATGSAREDVAAMQAAAERAAGITRQLLGFSGGNAARPELVQSHRIVTGLMPTLRRLLPDTVTMHVDEGDTRLGVHVDRAQFEQVIVNLVANARDAMPLGGDLYISVKADNRDGPQPRVLIVVRDTGGGIPDAFRDRIFEPFFTTKSPGRGTGLGLAMVESIVRRSGGRIDVDTGPDRGTTFTISLPRVEAFTPAVSHAPIEPVARGACGAILLVDDEPGVRRAMRRMLAQEGHEVIEAADGAAAIGIVETDASRIDLLVTDLMMPGVSGRELMARFRELRPGIPIICMTGFAPEKETSSPLAPEVHSVLAKPFTSDALKRAVAAALAGAVSTGD